MMLTSRLLLLLGLLGPVSVLSAQSGAMLRVGLRVQEQRLAVDSDSLDNAGIDFPSGAREELAGLVNRALTRLDELVRSGAAEWCFDNGACIEPLPNLVDGYLVLTAQDTTGEGALQHYFQDPIGFEVPLDLLLRDEMLPLLQSYFWDGTPLTVQTEIIDAATLFTEGFTLTFSVRPPIDLDSLAVVWDRTDTLSSRRVARLLGGLDGRLWYRQAIQDRLEEYYFLLNYDLEYRIDDSLIEVIPRRISRVVVKADTTDNPDKAFYWILPSALLRDYLRIPEEARRTMVIGGAPPGKVQYQFNLLRHAEFDRRQLPVFDADVFQLSQLHLNRLRYSLSVTPTPGNEALLPGVAPEDYSLYRDVTAGKIEETEEPDSSRANVRPATPAANREGLMGNNALPGPTNAFGHNRLIDSAEVAGRPRPTRFQRNYLGVGFDYLLDDAVRFRGIYQRLMEDGSTLSVQLGYAFNEAGFGKGGLFVSGNFFKDFLLFRALRRRLSVQLTANSLFTANRVLEGSPLRERRTGGKAKFDLEWFRNRDGHLLQTNLTLATERVALDTLSSGGRFLATTMSFTELGLLHYFTRPSAQYATTLRLEPLLRFGWTGLDADAPARFFVTTRLNVYLNQNLGRGWAFNLNGALEYNSEATPLFELSTLQPARNRAFREDDLLGRAYWGVQPEFWLPLPRFGGRWNRLNQYLYKHLRLAAFADLSYFGSLPGGQTGDVYLGSPGMGLRFIAFPAQVNFDWAYGLAPDGRPGNRGRFSINLVVNTPL